MELMYPEFVLLGLLDRAGWPKEIGLIRKSRRVAAGALDMAIQATVENAVAIGAGHPQRAVQLIASFFDRDWSIPDGGGVTTDDLLQHLGTEAEAFVAGSQQAVPWQAFVPPSLFSNENGPEGLVPWDLVAGAQFRNTLGHRWLLALWWGFQNADPVLAALGARFASISKNRPALERYGLSFANAPTSAEEMVAESVEFVDLYEQYYGLFPPAPVGLSHAAAVVPRLG